MIKLEHFRIPFRYCKVKFVIYLYASFINVKHVSRCVRKVIFCLYLLHHVKKCSKLFWSILWAPAAIRLSAIIFCSFSFNTEIIWRSHFSSKLVRSGTNSLSVWGKSCCSGCMNMHDYFIVLSSLLETTI